MTKFPVDAPKAEVLRVLVKPGFEVIREREHISLARECGRNANTFDYSKSHQAKKFDVVSYLHASRNFTRRVFESLRTKLENHLHNKKRIEFCRLNQLKS